MAKRKSTKVRLALVIYCVMNDNIIMDSTITWLTNASIQPSTTPKQTQARQISKCRTPPHPNTHHPTINWKQRQTKHRLYTETMTDITIRNSEQKDT